MSLQDFFIVNEIIFILMNAIGFWMAVLVYSSDKQAKINRYLALTIIFLIFWMDFLFIILFAQFLIPPIYVSFIMIIAARLIFFVTGPLIIFAYLFSLYFPQEGKRNYVFDKIYIFIWILLSFLAFTDLVVKRIEFNGEWGMGIIGGRLMLIFLFAAILSIAYFVYIPIKKYPLLNQEEKSKNKYFIVGWAIMGTLIGIFVGILPILRGGNFTDNPIYYLIGGYSYLLFNFIVSYAILNKKLFNIRVLLTQLLVVVMGILLLITPFLVNIPWLKTLLSMVFLLFCVFGWLLVRSSIREVRQKEILEQTVQERTKELQASKHELELNKIELEKKVAELEKWYKLTVGRELRMVELKQKIKTLEEDLKEKGGLKP